MDKVLKIVQLKDKQTDFSFWSTKTDLERLSAIEILRQQYINYQKDVQPRLQRVYRIINQKQRWILNCRRHAVGLHGHPRYTGDLEIWLNPSNENAERILKSVNEFGFSSYKLSIEDFTKPGNVIQLGYPPLRIDLLTEIEGVTFDECFKNKKLVIIDNLEVNFIGYNDLIKNKFKSGRPRDIDDINNLK